jgi:hypothetical protein
MPSLIVQRPWTRQPSTATPIHPRLKASGVWVGSVWQRLLGGPYLTTLTNTTIGPTTNGIAASMTGGGTSSVLIASDRRFIIANGVSGTFCLFRRSLDTTARNSTLFGFNNGSTDRIQSHAPFGDGNLYWDYADSTAGSGRVSVAFTKSTNWETLVFYAGLRGREVYRNGVLIASNASATASLTTSTTPGFYLGNVPTTGSDAETIALFVNGSGYEWSAEECKGWGKYPYERTFSPLSKLPLFSVSAGAALPTLSLSTYKPGTLTATGWQPRVTAS